MIPEELRADEPAGTKAPGGPGLPAGAPPGAGDALTDPAAAAGQCLLHRAADRGRPQAVRAAGWGGGIREGRSPGARNGPHSPLPCSPLPQATARDPPGTPRSRCFPHGLAGGLQPSRLSTPVPPAPDSRTMGSPEPQTTAASAPGGPFPPGKSLPPGFGRGAGRCHELPHGPPGISREAIRVKAPQQPWRLHLQPGCLTTTPAHTGHPGETSRPTALMSPALESCSAPPCQPPAATQDNPWPRGGPFTKGGPGPPAHSGGGT